ncbi:MAG TPA: VOC family protein [Candidatus Binataceae bacterium]|nr:VOC family protein [Candidatus Binataceae bacterium]
MIRTRGLSHINLNVSDIDRSARFYQEVFGLQLLTDYAGPMGPHPHGRQMIFSTPGCDDVIALSQVEGAPVGRGGLSHWGLNLERDADVDDAIEQVVKAGGTLLSREEYEVDGIRERHAYVTDPDGYVIELNAQRVQLSRKAPVRRKRGFG